MPADLVHLTQVISQHTQAMNGRQKVVDHVLFIPYMMYVAGVEEPLQVTGEALRNGKWPVINYFGKDVQLSGLNPKLAAWMTELADQAERTLVGETRLPVREYFQAIESFCGTQVAFFAGNGLGIRTYLVSSSPFTPSPQREAGRTAVSFLRASSGSLSVLSNMVRISVLSRSLFR